METVNQIFRVKNPTVYKSKEKPVVCAFPELVVGLELETENANPDREHYSRINTPFLAERDGSLRGGDTAYEFISLPIQLQYLIPELERFLKYAKFTDRNYTDRCSVHVHTNVTDFTQDMLASLSLVYTVVEETLFQYVNHFKSPTPEGYCRDTNLYCIPWNQCRMNHRLIDGIFNPSKKAFARWQKYTALNLLPITTLGTVEWRHMHGTADMEKLTGWLNIIGSIMRYAKRSSLDDVIKTIKTLNDTSAYQQFFTEVLQDHLKYNDTYAATLSEGVINAKYSLMDWDRSKIPAKVTKVEGTYAFIDDILNAPQPIETEDEPEPARISAQRPRLRQMEVPIEQAVGAPHGDNVPPRTVRINPAGALAGEWVAVPNNPDWRAELVRPQAAIDTHEPRQEEMQARQQAAPPPTIEQFRQATALNNQQIRESQAILQAWIALANPTERNT